MMAAASMRIFNMVLLWSLYRLSREGVLQTLASYGVRWKSYTEQYLDSWGVFRDAVLTILATIGKQERVRLSERTLSGLEKARRQGRVGGQPRVITEGGR
jgi:DNA invertase Pin-like site-specific DNA recombinase